VLAACEACRALAPSRQAYQIASEHTARWPTFCADGASVAATLPRTTPHSLASELWLHSSRCLDSAPAEFLDIVLEYLNKSFKLVIHLVRCDEDVSKVAQVRLRVPRAIANALTCVHLLLLATRRKL